ncbi:hypothetical protein NXY56_003164 [Leishmania guyanensis]|uniref:Uncharacterized protein n=6 Tax=Viannia TaxID=37616 RepID=A4HCY6_LEIBR|nr:conserved hypothetical protein [Leishmania braziliensis MHOM/BR/75/M2904]KAI5688550.1 hypothetical protein MNV84_04025 [Leishmania braziliensis]CCM15847.1 hypothetical protein, conserved [Leishmania guyanensis]CAJ2473288.1 unnamed protein product [Leishmania braziliensis]CAJ2473824.1 unnamed protein product [Leishmania braziliensis]CAM36632.1 conserved hypothetical protein [Leishmania braziliensis MHOM/BR/75/M2904]
MGNPYQCEPEVKWYHILWDMRSKEFRQWYLTKKYRDMRIMYKYESHILYQKAGMGFLMAAVFMSVFSSDLAVAVFRWPTEDPNELLKSRVWQKYHNLVNERKEYAERLLQDSNYVQKKNNSGE